MELQGLLPLRKLWKVSSARGHSCWSGGALLGSCCCFKAARARCMLLAANLSVETLDGAEARVFALGIGALPSVETEAQRLVATLRCNVCH